MGEHPLGLTSGQGEHHRPNETSNIAESYGLRRPMMSWGKTLVKTVGRPAIFWAIFGLMVLPGTLGLAGASSSSHPSPLAPSILPTHSVSLTPTGTAFTPLNPAVLPGSLSASTGPEVGPQVGYQWATKWMNENHSAFSTAQPPSSILQPPSASLHPAVAANSAPATAHPVPSINIPTGTFTGYVNSDLIPKIGISGVQVQAYGKAGQNCPVYICAPVTSDSKGHFAVVGPVGADFITYIATGWLNNESFATARNASNVYIGTVYMVRDGLFTGKVVGDVPGHGGIGSVKIGATSIDGSITTPVAYSSSGTGSFAIYVPPLPSIINFVSPVPRWINNFTIINATQNETVDLGTFYLEPATYVSVKVYDAITARAIAGEVGSLTICPAQGSPLTENGCLTQGLASYTNTLTAWGLYGPVIGKIEVTGYAEDQISFTVPRQTTFNYPKSVFLIPIGTITFNVEAPQVKHTAFGTGWYDATICGLSGYSVVGTVPGPFGGINTTVNICNGGCVGPTGQVTFAAAPLHNEILIYPDTGTVCNPFGPPMWPLPGFCGSLPCAPVWQNQTWFNVTPGRNTYGGFFNFTVGTYVHGNTSLVIRNETGIHVMNPGLYCAYSSPRDYSTLQTYEYCNNGAQSNSSPWTCSGGYSANDWCLPAAPGYDQFRVDSQSNLPSNWTWGAIEPICCRNFSQVSSVYLSKVTGQRENAINFSIASGPITGRVLINGTNLAPTYAAVQATCAFYTCSKVSGTVQSTGKFTIGDAPTGWDYLTVSAAGYVTNSSWVFVNTTKATSIGTIYLIPKATLDGFIRDANGNPIYSATVRYCNAIAGAGCFSNPPAGDPIGPGTTTTNGYYNGTVTGAWLPLTTYIVAASASGYGSAWTWVNATQGGLSHVPTLYLQAEASGNGSGGNGSGSGGVARAASTVNSGGISITGRLIDSLFPTWGIETSAIDFCAANTYPAVCTSSLFGSNTGGVFNDTVQPGNYILAVHPTGFSTTSVPFNTSSGSLNVGTISLNPVGWVTGRVVVGPLSWNIVQNWRSGATWGPSAQAQVCASNGGSCGPSQVIDTSGNYNLTVPFGINVGEVKINPTGTGVGTVSGGFTTNQTQFNVTYPASSAGTDLVSYAFSEVSGLIRDNSTTNPANSQQNLPVRGASVIVGSYGGPYGSFTIGEIANMGGFYGVFLPGGGGPNQTQSGSQVPNSFNHSGVASPKKLVLGGSLVMPNTTLEHFGFVAFNVTDLNGAPVPFPPVSTSGMIGTTIYGASDQGNEWGQVNVTSPYSNNVTVTLGPSTFGGFYNTTNFTTRVNESRTAFPNATFPPIALGDYVIPGFGLIGSADVNGSGYPVSPVTVGVVDWANGRPIPGLTAVSASSDTTIPTINSQNTNWLGQFLVPAPIGKRDTLEIEGAAMYRVNATGPYVVNASQRIIPNTINAVGDGILVASVVGIPGNIPLPYATITDCTSGGICTQSESNASGVFWIDAAAGNSNLTVTAAGYATNSSVAVKMCSDCWMEHVPVVLYAFATILGDVRATPSGYPVPGANVSVCSNTAVPTGPCVASTLTDQNGHFVDTVEAGQYVLSVNATGYNASYRPLDLTPGETANLGYVFIEEYGTMIGTVLSSATLGPIGGSTVLACPTWNPAPCLTPAVTPANGSFDLAGPPGPYTVTMTAPGYAAQTVPTVLVSGRLTDLRGVVLTSLGSSQHYTVQGTVVSASDRALTIGGAGVSASINGSVIASTIATAGGTFALSLTEGVYTVSAQSNGYAPFSERVIVHGALGGLVLPLSLMNYTVSGRIVDGLTHQVVPGVVITIGGAFGTQSLGVSDPSGHYAILLSNGSYQLNATSLSTGIAYATLPFNVTVNGGPVDRDLSIYPPMSAIDGVVVDKNSGLPVPDATVTVTGQALDGAPYAAHTAADLAGRFTVDLPAGTYHAVSSSSGYLTNNVAFTVSPPTAPLTISLSPSSNPSTGTGGSPTNGATGFYILLGIAVAMVVLAGAFLMWKGRGAGRRRPPAAPARRVPGAKA